MGDGVLSVEGQVIFGTVLEIKHDCEMKISQSAESQLTVDLSKVTHHDTSIVSLMVRLRVAATRADKSLRFIAVPESVVKVIRVCGLESTLLTVSD